MAALDFPASSASPWTAPNGVIYTWNTAGWWEAAPTGADYLRLDATNGPVTGPLTFEGTTTHENGVEVAGGDPAAVRSGMYEDLENSLILVSDGASAAEFTTDRALRACPDKAGVTIGWQATGSFTQAVTDCRPFSSYINSSAQPITLLTHYEAGHNASLPVETVKGFSAAANLSDATTASYGFWSNLQTSTGPANYNFYAEGNAPNYFAGSTSFGTLELNPAKSLQAGAAIRPQGQILQYFGNQNLTNVIGRGNSDGHFIAFQNNNATAIGAIRQISRGLQYWVGTTRGGFYQSSDRRQAEIVTSISDATSQIKQLQPKLEGFIADELETIVPQAVSGTENAEEAIGTLTDAEGVVEADVTEPEAIPFGATWVQTGTRPVYQGVDQTKLIPLLTKALQEALERIEALEAAAGS